jgi:hypothetical protein
MEPLSTVAVCYHLEPNAFARRLQEIARSCGHEVRGVVVDNRGRAAAMPDGFELLRGSNEHLDFSGYFEGLHWLLERNPRVTSGNVLFANDSLITNHCGRSIGSRVIELDPLLRQLRGPAIGGKLDPYRAICLRNPWSGHGGYVSSFCFLLNAQALPAMGRLVDDARMDRVLVDRPIEDEAWGQGMPVLLRELIRAHLAYSNSPYLWPLASSGNTELCRKKACCVYFENRLSGTIGSQGAVVPINAGPRARTEIYLHESLARFVRAFGLSRQ